MKIKNNNKIPKHNYIIYLILVVFTVGVTFLLSNWYKVGKDLKQENTIMSEFLVGINEKEFENYIIENNNVIIYLASGKDEQLNNFEKEFKNLIIDCGLQNQVRFINLDNVDDAFFDKLNKHYLSDNIQNIKIGEFSNILIMENSVITSVLYNKEIPLNIDDVRNLFLDKGIMGQA